MLTNMIASVTNTVYCDWSILMVTWLPWSPEAIQCLHLETPPMTTFSAFTRFSDYTTKNTHTVTSGKNQVAWKQKLVY